MTHYPWKPATPHGNAISSRECNVENCQIRVDEYQGFKNITIAVGEARHYDWPNRTPIGEFGMLHATSKNKTFHDPNDPCGSAIPGNEIVGLKWRISAVAPKCRDAVPIDGLMDQYVQVDDIIQYLIDRKDQVTATSASGNDPITKDQSWSALPKGY